MVKERLNTIDVAISVANLKKMLTNLTLVNIYDITNRVFILKFSKNENKIYVLIEIGSRIHATQFLRSVDHLPSNFNAKLRKHLRNRRLRDVSQMCQDRIIDFTFSSEEYAHHLVVQLFLPGNIYLTDHEYKVMTVLKPKNTGDKFFKVGTNYVFDMEYNSWFEPVKKPLVEEALGNKKIVDVVKEVFPSIHNSFIASVLSHKFRSEGKEDVKKELEKTYSNEDLELAYELVEYVRKYLESLLNRKDLVPGYVYKNAKGEMEDFGVFEEPNSDRYEDFNEAVDAFFTKNELVKQEKKTTDKKPTKLSKIKMDQDKREQKLLEEIRKYDKEIQILEENIDIAENCLNLTKALIASGASWNDIYEQIQVQRKENHPLVRYIKEINIPNQTLSFMNEMGEGRGGKKEEVVVLDYRLNGHQNLKDLYNRRKKTENKLERTKIGKEYALKKVTKSMSKQKDEKKQTKKSREVRISTLRKRFWFEKFYWFITSQGYLVLAGRDALQNELLVKKYLTKGDLYLHADIHGASSVILKMKISEKSRSENEIKEKEESEEFITKMRMSIEEAGTFATCHSNAWNEKFLVQSWWVYWHQVSKTPPTGEYVSQGSFVIRGKKNYIMPQKLEMGITYLFQVHPFQSLDTKEETGEVKTEGVENEKENEQTLEQQDHMEEDQDDEEDDDDDDDELEEDYDEEQDEDEELDELDDGEEYEDDEDDNDLDVDVDDEDEDEEEDLDDEETDELEDEDEEDENSEDEQDDEEELDDEDVDDMDNKDDQEKDQDEEEEEEESEVKTVQIGTVETITEYEANIQKRTRGRLATGHPNKAKLNNLREQLDRLNLNLPTAKEVKMANEDDEDDEEDHRTIRIQEPEKMEHTEEAVRKIRQRKATCINPNMQKLGNLLKNKNSEEDDEDEDEDNKDDVDDNKKDNKHKDKDNKEDVKKESRDESRKKLSSRMMRFLNQKVRRMKKRYGHDDEETQELRRMLTGSKKLKEKNKGKLGFSKDLVGLKEEERERKYKDKDKEVETIDDRELEGYMKQLSCLTKELKEDDDVINVIPMCAPYSAVKHYKNSLKLVPGNAKKGTIATQSLQHFIKNDPGNAHYLKMITTDQLTLTLIGNCKFTNVKS